MTRRPPISTLFPSTTLSGSLHLQGEPPCPDAGRRRVHHRGEAPLRIRRGQDGHVPAGPLQDQDRKSTRLNPVTLESPMPSSALKKKKRVNKSAMAAAMRTSH